MAINIREILHPSDSDSIKFEKINYNFDQILANGGGPRGLKGLKGQLGNIGLTGEKGIKGDQGIQGFKGSTGSTDTPWHTVDPTGTNSSDYKILKPKRLNLTYDPVVYLGDDTFDETISSDGINAELDSKLTIKNGTAAFNYHIKLVDSVSSDSLVFTSEYIASSALTRYAIKNAFPASNVQLAINVDSIDFDSTAETTITGATGVTVQAGTGNADIKLETLGSGVLVVDANAEFKGYVKLAMTANPLLPVAGMLRYNSNNNTFEGYFQSNEWKELCTECGGGVVNSIAIVGGNIDANANGSPTGSIANSISIGGGNINALADGSPVGIINNNPSS
jgi:hypothetical protein